MTRVLAGFILAVTAAFAAVDNPICEKTGQSSYRISFDLSGPNERVSIFASSRSDRIDTAKPLAIATASPVEVTTESTGRIYFHLQPRNGPSRVVAVRRLDLEGAWNTRDMGGYRTEDGSYVRWGTIYRSAELNGLTDHDFEYLKSLNLKVLCDFRAQSERTRSPTDLMRLPGTRYDVLPISPGASQRPPPGRGRPVPSRPPTPNPTNAKPYTFMTAAAPQFAQVFHSIARGDLPLLFHCTAGKDRTGMMAGILLSLLGVSRETILHDYLDSTNLPDAELVKIAKVTKSSVTNLAAARRFTSVERAQLELTFDLLEKDYGSVETYLQTAVGLSDDEITTIRTRLLEK